MDDSHLSRTILGGEATEADAVQGEDDEITLILPDVTHRRQTGWNIGEPVDYIVKFLQKPAAKIGGKEVAVESKELSIESLQRVSWRVPPVGWGICPSPSRRMALQGYEEASSARQPSLE